MNDQRLRSAQESVQGHWRFWMKSSVNAWSIQILGRRKRGNSSYHSAGSMRFLFLPPPRWGGSSKIWVVSVFFLRRFYHTRGKSCEPIGAPCCGNQRILRQLTPDIASHSIPSSGSSMGAEGTSSLSRISTAVSGLHGRRLPMLLRLRKNSSGFAAWY